MITTIRTTSCWYLTHEAEDPLDTGIAHFPNQLDAQRALSERRKEAADDDPDGEDGEVEFLARSKAEECEEPCVRIVCDSCGGAMHWEEPKVVDVERGTHYDPTEIDHITFTDAMWTTQGDKHHCPDCPPLGLED